jgi:hypothetical protein
LFQIKQSFSELPFGEAFVSKKGAASNASLFRANSVVHSYSKQGRLSETTFRSTGAPHNAADPARAALAAPARELIKARVSYRPLSGPRQASAALPKSADSVEKSDRGVRLETGWNGFALMAPQLALARQIDSVKGVHCAA